jgi:hypothetical protein
MFTQERYRLAVHLRWADLESVTVRGRPLKYSLQKLRNCRNRPCCDIYNDAFVDGSERPRYSSGYERNPATRDHDDLDPVEVIVIRKKSVSEPPCTEGAAKSRYPEPVRVGSPAEGFERIREVGESSSLSPSDSISQAAPKVPRLSRAYKRATKNNEYISKRVSELRELERKLEVVRESPKARKPKEEYDSDLQNVRNGIARLLGESSETPTLPRGSGVEIPPPRYYPSDLHQGWCRWCEECGRCFLCRKKLNQMGTCQECIVFWDRYALERRSRKPPRWG